MINYSKSSQIRQLIYSILFFPARLISIIIIDNKQGEQGDVSLL